MPNRLLDITVRPDWEARAASQAGRAAAIWRAGQIAAAAAAAVSVALGALAPAWPGLLLVRLMMLALVAWGPPLVFLADAAKDRRGTLILRAAGPLAALAGAAALLAAAAPPDLSPRAAGRLPLPVALLAPAVAWALLLAAGRVSRPAARALGWVLGDGAYYALAGAAAGVALGFHMLIVAWALPAVPPPRPLAPAALLWLACYALGLAATGQELLLRGLGFHMVEGSTEPLPGVVARLTGLNLLLALIALPGPGQPARWLTGLAYIALLSAITTLLRYRAGSLAPALACHAAFTPFLVAVLSW